jgi:tripartite-type tricarboxylate transporter receptor subunit TctC
MKGAHRATVMSIFLALASSLGGCLAGIVGGSSSACAQAWPQRNVRFIVPLGPGSGTDIAARLFAERLAALWGKPVVVENRPGGDGIVGISAFVGAHDDHTLMFAPASIFTAHPYLHDKLPYDAEELFAVARTANTLVAVGVPAEMKISSLFELFARARAEPGRLNWAAGTGMGDFLIASFLKHGQIEMSRVPYRDTVQQPATDLAEGRIHMYVGGLAVLQPRVQNGKVKIIAVTNSARIPNEPDIPTVVEAGFPALALDGLVGLFATREMPADVRGRIAGSVRAVADETIANRLLATGQLVSPGGAAEFAASIDAQRATIASIAMEMGIKPAERSQ